MKQLLILSGKGGTGKTTVASAFIKLSEAKAYADCDVDAPNLHLVLKHGSDPKRTDFMGMPKAEIDQTACIKCSLCKFNCRFDAVVVKDDTYQVDPYACEGCGVCEAFCPASAITLKPNVAGELILYQGDAVFSTAQLKMGSGTSGMLVTEVKKQMNFASENAEIAIIDGSPGIGCPVIASLSGVDMVLIVAEPSISGISDMERIIKTAQIFHTQIAVCINKYDTNIENTQKIIAFCKKMDLPFTGTIPYDENALKAINNGQTIVDICCEAGSGVRQVFNKTMDVFLNQI